MTNNNRCPVELLSVPADFPMSSDPLDTWLDWVVCVQAAIDLVAECIDQAAVLHSFLALRFSLCMSAECLRQAGGPNRRLSGSPIELPRCLAGHLPMKIDARTRCLSIRLEDDGDLRDLLDLLDICSACLRQHGVVEMNFEARTRLENLSSRLATSLAEFSISERLGGDTLH